MTDPTTTPTSAAITDVDKAKLEGYNKALEDNRKALLASGEASTLTGVLLKGFGVATDQAGVMIDQASDRLNKFFTQLGKNGAATKAQIVEMSGLVNAVTKVNEAFSGKNFNTNTFTSQLNEILPTIGSSQRGMQDLARKMGIDVPAAFSGSADSIKKFLLNTAMSADNAIKLRDVYTHAMSATGELGAVHDKAGKNFENMNAMISMQQENMNAAIKATHLSAAAVQGYYTQLGTIPGALNANIDSLKGVTGGVGLLTSTIQLARGAGMDYSQVQETMRKAVVAYGSSIPEAMTFTARMSEVSKKFGIELQDVKTQLMSVSDAFRMFGKDTEGGAAIMNQYAGALKGTGLSGQASAEIVGNMTKQMSQLSTAQKAFISAQSGGPGGLQGAFGIDMMLRQQGGQKKVMDMVMKTMQNQMGPLVSTEEASQGGQAAAQFNKQILMLQQGPLGALAKTLPEAEHLIDAMKAMSEGKKGPDDDALKKPEEIIQQTMKEGAQYQEQTATGVSRMVALMEEAKGMASGGSLTFLQSGLTAGAGENFHDQAATQKGRHLLKQSMTEGAHRDPTDNLHNGDQIRDRSGKVTGQVIRDWTGFMKDIPPMLAAPIKGIENLFKTGNANKATEEYKQHLANNEKRRAELKNAPAKQRAAGLQKIDHEESMYKSAFATMAMNGGEVEDKRILKNVPDMRSKARMVGGAAESVNKAANRSLANTSNVPGMQGAHGPHGEPGKPGQHGEIRVKVEGMCINCGDKMRNQDQLGSMSPPALMPKG